MLLVLLVLVVLEVEVEVLLVLLVLVLVSMARRAMPKGTMMPALPKREQLWTHRHRHLRHGRPLRHRRQRCRHRRLL